MIIRIQWRLGVLFIASFLIITTGCKKEKDSSVIEIAGGNQKLIMMDFLPGNETVTLLTLKNKSTGSGAVHVKLVKDDVAVATAAAKLLPPNSYTLANLEFDVPANGSVDVPITINRSNLTVDTIWGIGLKIESATGATIANAANSLVVKFDLRNRWDGRYRLTGTFTDIASPTLTFTEQEVRLVTTGPNSVVMIPTDLGIAGYLILSGTSLSYYGSFGPIFNFDPATNKIVSVINSYGQPASNTRSAETDPSGTNKWDPVTKAITVKFFMKQPNTVTTPPYIRVYFNNTMIHLGQRF